MKLVNRTAPNSGEKNPSSIPISAPSRVKLILSWFTLALPLSRFLSFCSSHRQIWLCLMSEPQWIFHAWSFSPCMTGCICILRFWHQVILFCGRHGMLWHFIAQTWYFRCAAERKPFLSRSVFSSLCLSVSHRSPFGCCGLVITQQAQGH